MTLIAPMKKAQNVTLTLNASRGDVEEYPTTFGTGGTFGGYTFKEVKGAQ